MAYVLSEHDVGDCETSRSVYLDDGRGRKRLHSPGGTVMPAADDPRRIVIPPQWQTHERAREFADPLESHEAMRWVTSNAATPRVTILERDRESGK